jgi:ketosteroid isomerase-like protein
MNMQTKVASDVDVLMNLNREYIEAVKRSDVGWFREVLTDDFRCSLPDGSIIDRERFLDRAARPLDISNLEAHDIEIRVMGGAAIVHARTTFSCADGRPASGRYTDVWCRHDGRWFVAAAHFTRRVD